jgi:hypothetical protein
MNKVIPCRRGGRVDTRRCDPHGGDSACAAFRRISFGRCGPRDADLTVISNNAGVGDFGVGSCFDRGRSGR